MRLLLLLLSGCATSQSTGSSFDIAGQTLDGQPFSVDLSAAESKAVVVAFGASWCEPCLIEWPQLAALAARYGPKGVAVVIVLLDEVPEVLPALKVFFLERLKIGFPVIVGDSEVAGRYNVERLPDLILFDGHGTVVWREVGYRGTTMEDLADRLDRLLSDKTAQ